jgi:hypothetical protein
MWVSFIDAATNRPVGLNMNRQSMIEPSTTTPGQVYINSRAVYGDFDQVMMLLGALSLTPQGVGHAYLALPEAKTE